MARRGENIYQRKDGRWEGRYIKERNYSGKINYGYVYAYTYREVKNKLLVKKSQQILEKKTVQNYEGTVEEWTFYWLENEVLGCCKETTYDSYSSKVNCHILPILGSIKLNKLSQIDIYRFISITEKKVSISSLHAIFRVLICLLKCAERLGFIDENIYKHCHLPKEKKRKKQVLSEREFHMLIEGAKKNKNGLATFIVWETGMRIGEVCGLKWEDLDKEKRTIKIRRTLQRVKVNSSKKQTQVIEISPKTHSSVREIPLSRYLYKYLTMVEKKSESEYILSQKNKFLEPRLVRKQFKKLIQELELPEIPFHNLRHSFATRALNQGVSVAVISSILGHASTQMTLDIYTRSTEDEERKAIQKLSIH